VLLVLQELLALLDQLAPLVHLDLLDLQVHLDLLDLLVHPVPLV